MSTPELRASDADRDRAVAELREHTAAGRLTLEEFSVRAGDAMAARTLAELDELRRDLPAAAPAERPSRTPKRLLGVVFGSTQQTGRWRLPHRGLAFVLFGDLDVDLRRAQLGGHDTSLTAIVVFGNVDVYVPEGVDVDLGGFAFGGHRREWGADVEPGAAMPLLRVRVFSFFGTADVWRVPASWAGRTFRQIIRGLRRGEHRELPTGAD